MELSILYFKYCGFKFLQNDVGLSLSLKIFFLLANGVDPVEMLLHVTFSSGSSLFAKVPVYRYPEGLITFE